MKTSESKTKTGLVFSGGGGKGAYEIGVWKALRESGIDRLVSAVSGASVGGLNGALFVTGDYDAAERLWKSISQDKLMGINVKKLLQTAAGLAVSAAIPGLEVKALADMLALFQEKGWFSRDGLTQLINESGVCSFLSSSDTPLYVCVLNGNTGELEYPRINGISEKKILSWLLATCAIPVIFGSVEVNGTCYHDGGVLPGKLGNNTPYQPLIEKCGCTHIINIYLDRAPLMRREQEKYADIRFWNIVPSQEFDGKISALNFAAENAEKLIRAGYEDAKQQLMQFKEFMESEERYMESAHKIYESDEKFKRAIHLNRAVRTAPALEFGQNPTIEDAGQRQVFLDEKHDNIPVCKTGNQALVSSASGANISLTDAMNKLASTIDKQERELIDNSMDALIDEMGKNSVELLDEAFASISSLASTEGRIKHQMDQGFVSRIIGGITGKNAKLQAEINWDLNRSIYATQRMVAKLNKKHMLSMEAIAALGNKTDYLMSNVTMLYGKIKSLENKSVAALRLMRDAIASVRCEMLQRIDANTARIENHEKRLKMGEWQEQVMDLSRNDPDKKRFLLSVVSGFYKSTCGDWNDVDICRFRNVIYDAGLADLTFLPAQFFEASLVDYFSDNMDLCGHLPVPPEKRQSYPILTGMQFALEQPELPYEKINEKCKNELYLDCNCSVSGIDLAMEFICLLKNNDKSGQTCILLKEQYISALDAVIDAASKLDFDERILKDAAYLKKMIEEFKIVVPVTGKFSSGKSSLLNRYLGADILSHDVTPETAVATELTYNDEVGDGDVRIVVNYMDGHKIEKERTFLSSMRVTDDMAFIQVFLKNPRLALRKNIILVDMPGFDSGNDVHNKAISRYLHRGDFFINLMPADVPFDDSVISHLHEIYHRHNKKFALLITKAGRKPEVQINNLKKELVSIIGKNIGVKPDVGIVEVKDRQNSTIKDFEYIIDSLILDEEKFLASRYHDDVVAILNKVKKRICAIQKGAGADEAGLAEKMRDREKTFRALAKKVKNDLDEMKYNLCVLGREKLIRDTQAVLNGSTDQLVRAAEGGDVNHALNSLLRPVLQQGVKTLIDSEISRLETTLAGRADSMSGDILVSINIPAREKEKFSLVGPTIGAAVGFVVSGPLAAVVGGILGAVLGSKSADDNGYKNRVRNAVLNQVIPQALNGVMEKTDAELCKVAKGIRAAILADFRSEEENYKKQLEKIKNALSESRDADLKKKKAIENLLDRIATKITLISKSTALVTGPAHER